MSEEPRNGYVTYRALIGIVTPLIFGAVTIMSGIFSWAWSLGTGYQERQLQIQESQINKLDTRIDRLEERIQKRQGPK